jgi:hypothetical protein
VLAGLRLVTYVVVRAVGDTVIVVAVDAVTSAVAVLVARDVREMVTMLVVVGVVQELVLDAVGRQEHAEETREALHSDGM